MPVLTKREQRWLYLDKIDFKSITVIRGKDEHDKMIKGSVDQEFRTIYKYATNIRVSNHQIFTELKGEISNTVIGRHFKTPTFNNGENTKTEDQ